MSVREDSTPVLCLTTAQSCVGVETITAKLAMETKEVPDSHQPTPLHYLVQLLLWKWAWITHVPYLTTVQ